MGTNDLDPAKEPDYFLTVLGAVSLSAYFRSIAEAMLEARYPDPDAKPEKPEKHPKEQKEPKTAKKDKNRGNQENDTNGAADATPKTEEDKHD